MKVKRVGFDRAEVELKADEMGLLSDVLGQALGYQEPATSFSEPSLRETLDSLYTEINAALRQVSTEDERLSGPFAAGERVSRVLDESGVPVSERAPGIVVADHLEDAGHDYPWTIVRMMDGVTVDIPTHHLRRVE